MEKNNNEDIAGDEQITEANNVSAAQDTELNIKEQLEQMDQRAIAVAASEIRVSEKTTPKKTVADEQKMENSPSGCDMENRKEEVKQQPIDLKKSRSIQDL